MPLNYSSISFAIDERLVLFIGIPFGLILGFINVFGCAGIIWHEKFGSDNKRIFPDKIVASLSWVSIFWFLVIHPTEMLLYFYKPLPDWYCTIIFIAQNSIILISLIYIDTVLIVKYIFIFWMKNPENFQDDFWSFFVNIWVVMFR